MCGCQAVLNEEKQCGARVEEVISIESKGPLASAFHLPKWHSETRAGVEVRMPD